MKKRDDTIIRTDVSVTARSKRKSLPRELEDFVNGIVDAVNELCDASARIVVRAFSLAVLGFSVFVFVAYAVWAFKYMTSS